MGNEAQQPEAIQFYAVVGQARTLRDKGFLITLELPQTAISTFIMFSEWFQRDTVLSMAAVAGGPPKKYKVVEDTDGR